LKIGEFAEKRECLSEHAEDAGLSVVEEVKRYMFQALDRFKLEAETRFYQHTPLK